MCYEQTSIFFRPAQPGQAGGPANYSNGAVSSVFSGFVEPGSASEGSSIGSVNSSPEVPLVPDFDLGAFTATDGQNWQPDLPVNFSLAGDFLDLPFTDFSSLDSITQASMTLPENDSLDPLTTTSLIFPPLSAPAPVPDPNSTASIQMQMSLVNPHLLLSAPVLPNIPSQSPNSSSSSDRSPDSAALGPSRKRSRTIAKLDEDVEEDEVAAVRRHKNTLAARKYRQKRLDRIRELEDALAEVSSERDDLRIRLARQEAETAALKAMMKSFGHGSTRKD